MASTRIAERTGGIPTPTRQRAAWSFRAAGALLAVAAALSGSEAPGRPVRQAAPTVAAPAGDAPEDADPAPRFPLILAHRGMHEFAPANTIPAIEEALRLGADGSEIDVRLVASGEVVVFHDDTIERVCDGSGRVDELTLEQLRSYPLHADPAGRHPDVRVPTLDEVFAHFGSRAVLLVEMKRPKRGTGTPDDLEEKVGALIDRHGLYDTVFVSSLNPEAVARIRAAWPRVRTIFEYLHGTPTGAPTAESLETAGEVWAVGPAVKIVTPAFATWARERGFHLSTFSPYALPDLELVADLDFDLVTTMVPDLYRMVLEGAFTPDGLRGLEKPVSLDFDEPAVSYGDTVEVESRQPCSPPGCLAIPVQGADGVVLDLPASPERLYLLSCRVRAEEAGGLPAAPRLFVFERDRAVEFEPRFRRLDPERDAPGFGEGDPETEDPAPGSILRSLRLPGRVFDFDAVDEAGWRRARFVFRTSHRTRALSFVAGIAGGEGRLLLDDLALYDLSP
jgi:glycerophosphoryl diester phosphodiesterase